MWIGFEHSTPSMHRLQTALQYSPTHVHIFSQESPNVGRTATLPNEGDFAGRAWQVTRGAEFPARVDILLITAHGSDIGAPIWNLRRQVPGALVLVWLFDNHLSYIHNLRTVIAADGYFPSHAFCADYLLNPYSLNLGHLPAPCLQWTKDEIAEGLSVPRQRSDKFLAAYVDYPFSARHEFLNRLHEVPQAELFLMTPEDRSRYRSKSRAEKIAEWCNYKTSVVAPVERDLSTRLFDALASGQIPLVADSVLDLDSVIPLAVQANLPILRFREGEIASLLAAHAEALGLFDAEGQYGIWRRHTFVSNGHFMRHRLQTILATLVALAEGRSVVAYHPASTGLVLRSAGTVFPMEATSSNI